MMRRHLYIVLNHGDKAHFLSNIDVDRDNYLEFFTSPEGGFWHFDKDPQESEISVYEDNFDFTLFKNQMDKERLKDHPLDYIVFVFCGHGYTDEEGVKWIEVLPGAPLQQDVSIPQLRQACKDIRMLFIDDACLGVYPRRKMMSDHRQLHEQFFDDAYAEKCRTIYNLYVLKSSRLMFTAGYAVRDGETADGDGNGGYYTQTLLKNARIIAQDMKLSKDFGREEVVSFSYIHHISKDEVTQISENKQHPSLSQPRSFEQLPFVVVPKQHIM